MPYKFRNRLSYESLCVAVPVEGAATPNGMLGAELGPTGISNISHKKKKKNDPFLPFPKSLGTVKMYCKRSFEPTLLRP